MGVRLGVCIKEADWVNRHMRCPSITASLNILVVVLQPLSNSAAASRGLRKLPKTCCEVGCKYGHKLQPG